MSRLDPGVRIDDRWARRGYDTVILLATLEAVLCLALSASSVRSGLAALMLAVVAGLLRRRRFGSPREIDRTHIP